MLHLTILYSLQWFGRLFLVLTFFAFGFFLIIFIVGSMAQRLNLSAKMGEKRSNLMIYIFTAILYLLFVILVLIPWAKFLLS